MTIQQQIKLVRRTQTDLLKEATHAPTEILKTTLTEQATALDEVIESLRLLDQVQACIAALLAAKGEE